MRGRGKMGRRREEGKRKVATRLVRALPEPQNELKLRRTEGSIQLPLVFPWTSSFAPLTLDDVANESRRRRARRARSSNPPFLFRTSLTLLLPRLQEEDPECPLCMEEMDLSDINFKPCPCGYQVRPSLSFSFLLSVLLPRAHHLPSRASDLSVLPPPYSCQPQQAMPSLSATVHRGRSRVRTGRSRRVSSLALSFRSFRSLASPFPSWFYGPLGDEVVEQQLIAWLFAVALAGSSV